jgi:hypothetical protein
MARAIIGAVAASTVGVLLGVPASAGTAVHGSAPGATAAAGSAVHSSQTRPDLAGLRVRSPNSAPIYLIDPEGYRRWIPNPATYDSLFRSWDGVVDDLGTNLIATRPALDDGAFLARAPGSAPVFLISNGQKRWIVFATGMDKYWFDWNKVRDVPASALDAIPTGPHWY